MKQLIDTMDKNLLSNIYEELLKTELEFVIVISNSELMATLVKNHMLAAMSNTELLQQIFMNKYFRNTIAKAFTDSDYVDKYFMESATLSNANKVIL